MLRCNRRSFDVAHTTTAPLLCHDLMTRIPARVERIENIKKFINIKNEKRCSWALFNVATWSALLGF